MVNNTGHWLDLSGSGVGQVAGAFENSKDTLSFIKLWENCLTIYKYTVMYQTQQNFMFIIVLGQHVSTLIESSSGPSKIQILT